MRRVVFASLVLALSGAAATVFLRSQPEVPPRAPTGLFVDPEGLAIDAAGQVYVADEDSGALLILSPDLELLARIGAPPDEPDHWLTRGGGVAPLESGRVALVGVFSDLLELRITGPTSAELVRRCGGGLDGTEGIAVGPDGRLYVAEEDTSRVVIFDREGQRVGQWQLDDMPEHLTFVGDDLYICYAHGDWIGRHAPGTGALRSRLADDAGWDIPDALAVGPDGLLYVTDQGNHRVVVVRPPTLDAPGGQVVRVIGRRGSAPGELRDPEDLVFDHAGRLIVADGGNGRLQVFDLEGRSLLVVD